ncbi:serine protease [Cupriavidus sp. AcVe19-1a]|uniref:trypsin-like serine peptidase n=1 Tax=Cupriavidus sp. AcVe19-1a TaxID=2821359 RepID=UPI001AE1B1FA|nr:serine protease [Cupriavidus sp. AcVe19-1a]MBP0633071.1 trypsin-like peptidase domain-containing protein [Cupriavidus sp. AcVe19-1a]
MPVKVEPQDIAPIRNAIVGTFTDARQLQDALQSIVGTLDPPESRPALVLGAGTYNWAAFKLVETWNARGHIADLVGGLQRLAPRSADLNRLQRDLFVTSAADLDRVELQGFVQSFIGPAPAAAWLDKLGRRMRAVCRIEFGGQERAGVGTGFLVGADAVLTANHVVEMIERQPLLADDAICRFGCLNDMDKPGVAVRLRRPKYSDSAKPPGADELFPGGAEPNAEQLDYTLLRLGRDFDAEPFEIAKVAPAVNDPIVVLQHPKRAPLRIALGRISGFNASTTRLRHSAATEQGSSGAPCLNQDLEVIALHNAARYAVGQALAMYNTAVPISRIAAALSRDHVMIGTL